MERSGQRRLDCVSRHFLSPCQLNPLLLQKVLLNGGKKITDEAATPVVIGGVVLDIQATPSIPLYPRSTTPGNVHFVLGGVARNVAESVSKLGPKPYMISAVGTDMAGKLLLDHWSSAGLSTQGILKHLDIETAVICITFDTKGEVVAGVASMEAIESFLTSSWIQQSRSVICRACIVMVDANLSSSALQTCCQVAAESNTPVWFEPVSVVKSKRIASVVKYVTFASPNEAELMEMANALSGGNSFSLLQKDDNEKKSVKSWLGMLKPAILVLLEKGIETVVVTIGADGVLLCSRGPFMMRKSLDRANKEGQNGELYDMVASRCPKGRYFGAADDEGSSSSSLFCVHFPALPAKVVRLTGAGDCLVGGTIACLCGGLDIMQSVAFGIAVAKTAVESETNVAAAFSLSAIADDARLVYEAAQVLLFQESAL